MFLKNPAQAKKWVNDLLDEELRLKPGDFSPMVRHLMEKREKLLSLATQHKTPFYALDTEELQTSLRTFKGAFKKILPECEFFYAMKVNHHPWILKNVVKEGFGIDVSSGRELALALPHKPKKILYTGPGKTADELELALRYNDIVTVNIDSFGELKRLGELAKKRKKTIRAGVRLFTRFHGSWTKFGVSLSDLKKFWDEAKKYPKISLEGIQIHMSWNRDATPYQNIIKELAGVLKKEFNPKELKSLRFIDFGGGFKPYQTEGFFPWKTPQGGIVKIAADHAGEDPGFKERAYMIDSVPMEVYAKGIAQAIKQHLKSLLNCVYYTEPGRIICNNAMHVVTRIVDVKGEKKAIADGGINAVGWERFENDYFPLINLTHPSDKEMDYRIYGPLCMPQDLLGYSCHASKIEENDVILIPYQGALTYSLAQNFIKPIPKAYIMK